MEDFRWFILLVEATTIRFIQTDFGTDKLDRGELSVRSKGYDVDLL